MVVSADEVVGLVQGLLTEVAGAVGILRDLQHVFQPEPSALRHTQGHGEFAPSRVQGGLALTHHRDAAATHCIS